ncbi:P-loop containing nucleoside triphosphate hydrolase protein [Ceratobasidium sp. AG-I]|nr:P-loop containing nucleoside triphosphate hydrolase protein [Ceratobasidium sp. AG-I]
MCCPDPVLHWHTQESIEAVAAEEAANAQTKPGYSPVPDADVPEERSQPPNQRPDTWRQIALTVIPLLELIGWTVGLVLSATGNGNVITVVTSCVVLASWVYAALRPNLRPSCTPYYDLLILYFAQFLAACVALYEASTTGVPGGGLRWSRLAREFDAILTFGGIITIINMPLHLSGKPQVDAEGRFPALEDHCTLLQWITFSWVSPLIALGARQPLGEKDMWQLSRSMRTRVLMRQFSQLKRSSLLRRLLAANARDMFLDLTLTILSSLLNFAPPIFLNLILRALAPNQEVSDTSVTPQQLSLDSFIATPNSITASFARPLRRSDAYYFALAAFLCQIIKSQADLQHLFFGRRASIRIKAELVASVYEKALKRKDIVGTVQKTDPKGKGKAKDTGAPPKETSGADVGKIVSLISADAEWIAQFVTLGSFIYDAPVSAVVSVIMLYNLMGYSAFVGYIVLLLTLPINQLIIKRMGALQVSVSMMRDARIRAMNEAIHSIKFIKFSAWESRWIQRVLDARHAELGWLRKIKLIRIFASLVWGLVPVGVAAIGFAWFTLVEGRELTVDIAFPCLAVFGMLSMSLTILPLTVASTVRTLVSLQRIDTYLSEPEVPDHVSSLKRPIPNPHAPIDSRLGCANATFRWSSAPAPTPAAAPKKKPASNSSLWSRMLVTMRLRKKVEEQTEEEHDQDEEERPFELKDISVVFPEGVLSIVCGPTGSGKSSLLAAILGEMDKLEGEAYLPKEPTLVNEKTGLIMTVGYCAQVPWLEHESIKENILFGSPFDKERYEATVACCALQPDLDIFEDGDETEIGEKGVSLSGGQKARVALARAVYARTQVVILDDVLSAVDSHTAEHLVQRCLRGPLLKGRTVVLVTHHVDLVLPFASWVVKLHEGRVDAQGTVETLRESGSLASSREGRTDEKEQDESTIESTSATEKKGDGAAARKLVEEEGKSTGNVKTQVYHTYLSAASYWLFGLWVLLMALGQASELGQKFWIKHWGESYRPKTSDTGTTRSWLDFGFPSASDNVMPYLLVYVGIQGVTTMLSVLTNIPNIWSSLRASRSLYERMLRSVMRSPSRFFDKTPSGRILNRFSKDIDTIDSGLQSAMISVLMQVLSLIVSIAAIVYAVPYFVVLAIVIAYAHLWFSNGFVTATRDLRRIESNTRSPIISSFSELLTGIATIRAFGVERAFLHNVYKRLDLTQSATHYYWMCNRWLLVRFDTLGAFSVLVATVGSVHGGASAGLTGIVVTQAQQYVRGLYWGLRSWTELEQSLNSVERVQEYLDLPSEPPLFIESNRPPAAWPSATKGTLVVENLVLKYAPELDPVLNGVSFSTKPSEKIGIVGRTGSGKSTLALALFRFVDPVSGKITLDGIDVTSIGLEDLRSRLTLIPQDAVLFKGTIRDNLDPFNEYTDAECLEALQRVHLPTTNTPNRSAVISRATSIKDAIETEIAADAEVERPSSEDKQDTKKGVSQALLEVEDVTVTPRVAGSGLTIFSLETQVSEGGNNFSQGQRQLVSMARALLRKSNLIVMDESTASVDFETDAKIQATIREEFRQSILITIAHRLHNDRILVLSAGRVIEFDTPKNLLEKEDVLESFKCQSNSGIDFTSVGGASGANVQL